jgi:uncharacterized protein
MLTVSQLFIYPIKSLAGIAVSSATVTDRGFQHDRRYMLTNEKNGFLTIREFPQLTRLQPVLEPDGLRIVALDYPISDLFVPTPTEAEGNHDVTIWNATVRALPTQSDADRWFSEVLNSRCKLAYMPDSSMRPVDTTSGYKPAGKFTSFADAYPFMLMGEASLTDLNERYAERNPGKPPITIHRFRPNIVMAGGAPNQEDDIEAFTINGVSFRGLEKCARCTIPNVDPETGLPDPKKEPLATLSKYRTQDRKINFGRNVVHSGIGVVNVGEPLVLEA